MVFADATIPRNLILGGGYKPVQRIPGEPIVYSAILVLVSITQTQHVYVVLTPDRVEFLHI